MFYFAGNVSLLYPFYYNNKFQILEDGWLAFTTHSEFSKYMNSSNFRITDINRNFQVRWLFSCIIYEVLER